MLSVSVDTSSADILGVLRDEKRRQYAVVNALNDTALLIQQAERANLLAKFHVRPERADFMLKQVAIISPRANVNAGRFSVRIRVGDKPRLLLSKFETGGTHEPVKGKNVAIPITGNPARLSIESNITPEFTFPALALRRDGKAVVGEQSTYVIPNIGLFQKQGSGSKIVYLFRPSVKLDGRLGFYQIAQAVTSAMFEVLLLAEVKKSLDYGFKMAEKTFNNLSGD